jgi:hypothetical protein
MTYHPLRSFSSVVATHVRVGVITRPRRSGRINRLATRDSRRTLHDRPDHRGSRNGDSLTEHTESAIIRSGASHEVLSPSALAGRVALSGAAGHQTIPLRRFVRPPALCGLTIAFYALAVFRIAEAAAAMLA